MDTYQEYLEQREKELQEEVEFWHRAWKDTRAENEALKSRVAELEKLALYLDKQSDAKTALIGQIIDDLAKAEDENEALKARVTVAEMGCEELESYGKELEADVNTLQIKLAAREEYIESQEANIRFLKRACGWDS